jgi:hypothetical protein
VLAGSRRAAGEALPSLLAPSSLLRRAGVARRENSAAALRSLAGFAGSSRRRRSSGNSAAALRSLAGFAGG